MAEYVNPKRVSIEVFAGLCRIEFDPGSSCGRDPDYNPGISFTLIGDVPARQRSDGKHYHGMGVIGRADAQRLRGMLEEFLREHPPASVSTGERD